MNDRTVARTIRRFSGTRGLRGLTDYDREHLVTYLRLLDAEKEGASWCEVTQLVLRLDPADQPDRARRAYDTHLARARWISTNGYFDLLG